MSDDDKDDFEDVDEYPVFNRATSKFEWHKTLSPTPQWKTYGFEIEGGMGFIAGGFRVKNTPDN